MQNIAVGVFGGVLGLSHGLWLRHSNPDSSFAGNMIDSFNEKFLGQKNLVNNSEPLAQNLNLSEQQDNGVQVSVGLANDGSTTTK